MLFRSMESIYTASTFSDPILTEQESFLGGEGGSELEHAGDKGQRIDLGCLGLI